MDAVRAETIRTLYVQARFSAVAAMVVTTYMVVAAWTYSSHRLILAWLIAQVLAQLARIGLVLLFGRRSGRSDMALPHWAHAYTLYMACAGLLWGATPFLFMHDGEPITIALTLCGLYGIASGSVPGNAYNPAGLYAFVIAIFGGVLIELLRQQQFVYTVLGVASAGFAGILMLFCRVQARTIETSFAMRFENRALLEALTVQREAAEAARAEAEKASLTKSQFLAAASHDLRQPLHALSLLTGSLRALALSEATQRLVAEMLANIRALEGLFNGLLDIARFDAGVVRVARSPLASDELFDRLNHYLAPTAAERGIALRFRSDGTLIFTDPVLIEQIMLNLASNAVHNTDRGGVLCAARRRGDKVRLEVWDTGRGIAPDALERIFDEFFQVGGDRQSRRRGMGLGLAIARRSAALLGAEIGVASRPGRGTIFWLSQPVAAQPAPDRTPIVLDPASAAVIGSDLHALFVDDDEAVRRALALLLDEWSIPARIVATGEEGIAAAQAERFSHIFSDVRLPAGPDGLDVLLQIRTMGVAPDAALYLVTGDMDATLIARADRHAVPLLHKPLSPERLRALLVRGDPPSEET